MLTPLIDGLGFAEGLRWHNGQLWFSDFISRKVQSITPNGQLTRQGFIPGQPSGLGFLADGSQLAVSMLDRKLIRYSPDENQLIVDLSDYTTYACNDMLTDHQGNSYIGCFNHDYWYGVPKENATSPLLLVSPSGEASVAASGLKSPNGIVRLPNSNTLVVAETAACCLSAFDIAADGSLSNKRLFADLGDIYPDGICVNADGDIWVAGLYQCEFLLVSEAEGVLERIPTPGQWAVACALGGEDGSRLFCATATLQQSTDLKLGRARSAISTIDVAIPAPLTTVF